MAAVNELIGGTVGEVSFAATAAAALALPLCAELDAFLGVTFTPLQASLALQLQASLDFALDASLALQFPSVSIQGLLDAVASLQVALEAALSVGITAPGIGLSLDAGIQAAFDLAATLELKLGLLDLAVKAMLAIKIPAVELAAQIQASLSAGPVVLLDFGVSAPTTLQTGGTDIAAKFASGISLGGGIAPGEVALGYILVTKVPAAQASLDFILRGI